MVCDGRRVQWRDLEEIQEEKVVEIMLEMRGGMGYKKKTRKENNLSEGENPWLTRKKLSKASKRGLDLGAVRRNRWEGRSQAVDLSRYIKEEIKDWLGVETEEGLYLICGGRRVQWDELEEMQEERVIEVMVEMRGGMGNKKKVKKGKNSSGDENPWVTPDETEQSEPEKVGSWDLLAETLRVKVREEWERMVEKEKGEGGVLDMLVENMAGMEESHRKEAMRSYENTMPAEWGRAWWVFGNWWRRGLRRKKERGKQN